MDNALEVLKKRRFIKQITDEEAVREELSRPGSSCYVGLDPTADSLHVGSLLPIMALMQLQRCHNKPICIVGGGTAMVGDPSGKTEMRKMLSRETIERNAEKIRAQVARYLDTGEQECVFLNNAEWLTELNYIEFLRDFGRHFSVNRMLAAESYRMRMETGLSFIEFNYQLLQAYDFLHLYKNYGCRIQMGGDDQWGNIVAGTDLIRRVEGGEAEGMTWPLLETASGEKMGKTAQGAVWLDAEKTSPYDFYQYWINVDDRDVERFLGLFTFVPMEEIGELCRESGAAIRKAKRRLAVEATRISHGERAALEARQASEALFVAGDSDVKGAPSSPCPASRLDKGWPLLDAMVETGLAQSKGAARRLVRGGGAYVNEERVLDELRILSRDDVEEGRILLRSGKKAFHRVDVIEGGTG